MSKYVAGQWNAICDRCGFKFKSSELREDWQGLMVCSKDFETRHPQSLIKTTTESAFPSWTRPEVDEVFLPVCYVWTRSAYADLGTADCLVADSTSLPYQFLLNLRDNNA